MVFQQADGKDRANDSLWDSIAKRDDAASNHSGPTLATPWLFGPAEVRKKQANQFAADEDLFGGRF